MAWLLSIFHFFISRSFLLPFLRHIIVSYSILSFIYLFIYLFIYFFFFVSFQVQALSLTSIVWISYKQWSYPVSCKLRSIFSNFLTQEECGIDPTPSGLVISINRKRLGPLVSCSSELIPGDLSRPPWASGSTSVQSVFVSWASVGVPETFWWRP